MNRVLLRKVAIATTLLIAGSSAMAQSQEARSVEEVRNTVINLLEALVQKGVVTKEQAAAMVAAAQNKAGADAKARADQEAAEKDAVRVTYVPELVRKQIGDQVRNDIKAEVTQDVLTRAQSEGWGVPGALPDWIQGVRLYGDVRARTEGNLYASDNPRNLFIDINRVNAAGGIGRAGVDALLNTSEDRNRLVGRVRAGLTANLGNAFSVDVRLASGNSQSPVSTNQTLGNYGSRWSIGVDKAAILWNPVSGIQEVDLRFGRFANPFVATSELMWDADLTFEGISATYALDLFGRDPEHMERGLFATVGAFPLQEVELSKDDKWLYGAQLGGEFAFAANSRLRLTAGYFSYENVTGVRNVVDSSVFDFTAPRFLQKGNTLFDIRNDTDNGTNLFALAGEYEIANANVSLDFGFGATHLTLTGEYVKNVGWDSRQAFERSGTLVDAGTVGYDAGIMVGRPKLSGLWQWRTFVSYRYVERDAVLDAFTDSDFHLGGTNAKGYQLGFDLGLSRGAWLRLRYLTADAIDGPPLGIDVWQLDLNGAF